MQQGVTLANMANLTVIINKTRSFNVSVLRRSFDVTVNKTGGVGSGGVSDGDKGSIIVSGGGLTWTIKPGSVSNDMLAGNIAQSKVTNLVSDLAAKANASSLSSVAFSGDYTDLINKPTIPTLLSQLTNDTNFETTTQLNTRDTNNRDRANHTGSQLISTITGLQTALDGKQAIGDYATNSDLTTGLASKENTIIVGTTSQYWRGDKSWQTLDKSAVGLDNIDNTSDLNKPISTATQTALNAKANNGANTDITSLNALTTVLKGSEIVTTFDAFPGSVNYLEIKANTTTFSPRITAVGSDTNISINLVPKGTGRVFSNGIIIPTISSADTITNKIINGSNNTITNVSLTTGITGILPIANGGTGSATQNFVDLSNAQTVAGIKTFSSTIIRNGNAGTSRNVLFRSAGVTRWELNVTSESESGSNAGSNLWFNRYADDGSYIDSPFRITRSNGQLTYALTNTSLLFIMSGSNGYQKGVGLYTGAVVRWIVGSNNVSESGSDVGSDFFVARYNDAGALQDTPISVKRSSGDVTLLNRIYQQARNTAPTDGNLPAASISFYLDESGNNLKVRVKYADGTTLKTGTLAIV